MTLQVGAGLLAQMTAAGDHPITDESTLVANADGTVVQTALGLKGRYVASNASGGWESSGPLALGA